jgi:glycosyltransferase involved in cell wall biosynthesis
MPAPFINRVVVLDPGMLRLSGHHHAWNAVLRKAFERRNLAHEFVFPTADLFHFPQDYEDARAFYPRAHCILQEDFYAKYKELDARPTAASADLVTRRAGRLRDDLAALDDIVDGRTLIFGHTLDVSQCLGLALWSASRPEGRRPRLALNIHFSFAPPTAWTADGYRLVVANLPDPSRVRFFSVIDRLADFLTSATGRRAEILPMAFDLPEPRPKNQPQDLVFGFVGDDRAERNIALLPDLIREYLTRGGRGRFLIQLSGIYRGSRFTWDPNSGPVIDELTHLAETCPDRVEFILGGVYGEEYQRLLSRFNVILLPFSPEIYHSFRASQVLQECLYLGRPAVVGPSGFLADETAKWDNGSLRLPEISVKAAAEGLLTFDAEAAERLGLAAEAGRAYRRFNHVDTLIQTLTAPENWPPDPERSEKKTAVPRPPDSFRDPDLSLVIPARNAEATLARCLDSIVRQASPLTYECLVVDDGSADGTADIVTAYARDFPQVRLISAPPAGAGPARNLGLNQARGRYLWFVDSDDELEGDALARLAPLIGPETEGPEALVFLYWRRSAGGLWPANPYDVQYLLGPAGEKSDRSFTSRERPQLLGICTFPWNKIFRRDFIERRGLRFAATPVYNDVSFVLAALLTASAIRILPRALYRYTEERPEPGQLRGITDERRLAVREVFDACAALLTAEQAAPEQWKYYLAGEFNALIWNISLVGPDLRRLIREYAVREARRRPSDILERLLLEDLLIPAYRAAFISFLAGLSDSPLLVSVILDGETAEADDLDWTLKALDGPPWQEDAYEVIVAGPASGPAADVSANFRRPHFRTAPPEAASAASPFERGLRLARGRYVYFLGGPAGLRDDLLSDGLLRLADGPPPDLLLHDFEYFSPQPDDFVYKKDLHWLRLSEGRLEGGADLLLHNFEYFSPQLDDFVYKEERNWLRLIEGHIDGRALSRLDREALFCGLEAVGGLKFYRTDLLREKLADPELRGLFAHQALVDWACLSEGREFLVSNEKLLHPLQGDEPREQAKKTARLDRMLAAAATIRGYLTRPDCRPLRAVFMRLFIKDWAALPAEAQARYGRGIPSLFPPLTYADYRLCTRLFIDARVSDALYVLFMSRSRPLLAGLARGAAGFILPRVIRPWRRWKAAVLKRLGRGKEPGHG